MRVLVTGASGMLGRAVAQTIERNGHDVTVMQRRPSGLDYAEIRGDITDVDAVASAVRGQDAIVHLAALVSPTGVWKDFVDVNVSGTKNLLTAGASSEDGATVSRFIYVSSPSVASSGAAHVGESALPADPSVTKTHYARSKAIAEQLVLGWAVDNTASNMARGTMAVAAIRPHLVWGPGDEQLVARIVERAATGRLRLLGSGAALIDSTYVDNAADAIAAALEHAPAIDGRALVVSNDEPRPVAELLRGMCTAAGLRVPDRGVPTWLAKAGGALVEGIWTAGRIAQDPPMTRFLAEQLSTAHWYDQRQTQALLNWTPKISIDEGMAALAAWYQSNS